MKPLNSLLNLKTLDIINRGYPNTITQDFLTWKTQEKFNTIITNPPYSLAKEFVEKSIEAGYAFSEAEVIQNDNAQMKAKAQNDIEINILDDNNEFFAFRVPSSDIKTKHVKIPSRKTLLFGFSLNGHGNLEFSNAYTKFKLLN